MIRLIFAIIGLVAAGGIFFYYTKPTYDSLQSTNGQIAEYNAALDKANELQQLKQSLLSRYNSFGTDDLDRLQKLLPDHVDNISLILDLDSLATRYGLALVNVDIASPQDVTTTGTPLGAIGASSQKYDSLSLKFSTRGTYTDFLTFMTQLESSLRIVDLVSLTLTPDSVLPGQAAPQGAQVSADPIYKYDVTLRTYWLK
jgi:Tfp pilus assembly protein PilO